MMGEADDDAGREATTVEALPFVFLGASPYSHRNGALPPSTGLIVFFTLTFIDSRLQNTG